MYSCHSLFVVISLKLCANILQYLKTIQSNLKEIHILIDWLETNGQLRGNRPNLPIYLNRFYLELDPMSSLMFELHLCVLYCSNSWFRAFDTSAIYFLCPFAPCRFSVLFPIAFLLSLLSVFCCVTFCLLSLSSCRFSLLSPCLFPCAIPAVIWLV